MYIDKVKEQQTSLPWKSYRRTIIFQRMFIYLVVWVVWGNSFCKELFRHTIQYTVYRIITNFENWMLISQFLKRSNLF